MKTLFSPYLDVGSNGTAVDVLQAILCGLGYGEDIVRDGDYGEITKQAMMALQRDLGFTGEDVDGNFGPATRAALKEQKGIDVSLIPYSDLYDTENIWFGPKTKGPQKWDGEAAFAA